MHYKYKEQRHLEIIHISLKDEFNRIYQMSELEFGGSTDRN